VLLPQRATEERGKVPPFPCPHGSGKRCFPSRARPAITLLPQRTTTFSGSWEQKGLSPPAPDLQCPGKGVPFKNLGYTAAPFSAEPPPWGKEREPKEKDFSKAPFPTPSLFLTPTLCFRGNAYNATIASRQASLRKDVATDYNSPFNKKV